MTKSNFITFTIGFTVGLLVLHWVPEAFWVPYAALAIVATIKVAILKRKSTAAVVVSTLILGPIGPPLASARSESRAPEIVQRLSAAAGFDGPEALDEIGVRVWASRGGESMLVTWSAFSKRAAEALGGTAELWASYDGREVIVGHGDPPAPPGPEIKDGLASFLAGLEDLDAYDGYETYAMAGQGTPACTVTCYDLRKVSESANAAGRNNFVDSIENVAGAVVAGATVVLVKTMFVTTSTTAGGAVTTTGVAIASAVPLGWIILGTVLVGGAVFYIASARDRGEIDWASEPINGCPGCGAAPDYPGWVFDVQGDFCFDPDCLEYGGDENGDPTDDPESGGQPEPPGPQPEEPPPGQPLTDDEVVTGGNPGNADLGTDGEYCDDVEDCTTYSLGDTGPCDADSTINQIECTGSCLYYCSSSY